MSTSRLQCLTDLREALLRGWRKSLHSSSRIILMPHWHCISPFVALVLEKQYRHV